MLTVSCIESTIAHIHHTCMSIIVSTDIYLFFNLKFLNNSTTLCHTNLTRIQQTNNGTLAVETETRRSVLI